MTSSIPPVRFQSTQWSMIVRAADSDGENRSTALEVLCKAYWLPVYVFLRRRGLGAGEAEDVTQDFFADLVSNSSLLKSADPVKGKFRTYLLAAVKHRLANHHRHNSAEKRGGTVQTLTVDWTDAEQRYAGEPVDGWTAEAIFHRRWALTLLDHVVEELAAHYASEGRTEWFSQLRQYLTTQDQPPYPELAERLNTTAPAVRVAVHRLRKQYRQRLVAELRSTIGGEEDVEQERAGLLRALCGDTT